MSSSSYRAYDKKYDITPVTFQDYDEVSQDMSISQRFSWENTLSYSWTIGKKNNFDAVIGQSIESWGFGEKIEGSAWNSIFVNDYDRAYLSNTKPNGLNQISVGGRPNTRGSLASFFGRKQCPTDITLMRYADILLMHSELTETADGMNSVRERANLDPVAYSLDAIQKERRYEFAMEGLRWAYMRRWGKEYAINALESQLNQKIWNQASETVMKDQGAGYRARYEKTYGFRPYPQSEVDLSNGALIQKDGWDASAVFSSWK